MARVFSKNLSNYCRFPTGTFGALLNGKAKMSVHAWVNFNSVTGAGGSNQIFQGTAASNGGMFRLSLNVSPNVIRLAGKSENNDTLQTGIGTTALVAGTWYSVGGVIDLTNKAIRVYRNGVQDVNSTGKIFGFSTFTPGTATANDWIGAQGTTTPANTDVQFDGSIADVALWGDDITSDGFLQLSKGFHPTLVNPQNLLAYFPLIGNNSPETDIMGSGAQGTIVGSVPQGDHPRVIY